MKLTKKLHEYVIPFLAHFQWVQGINGKAISYKKRVLYFIAAQKESEYSYNKYSKYQMIVDIKGMPAVGNAIVHNCGI